MVLLAHLQIYLIASTNTLTVTKIGSFEADGAINLTINSMTNVDINSGDIDGAIIGQ